MYLLDQTWLPFTNLMLFHVYNVLMVSSDYDRYMIEEDGRVEEELYKEYVDLGLSSAPKITFVSSEKEALKIIKERSFDIVIAMANAGFDKIEKFAAEIKEIKSDMPFIALYPSPSNTPSSCNTSSYVDYAFCWHGNPSLFLAMIKLIEDGLNLEHDTNEADVQVIILVEDSVRFTSSYLPQIYTSLIHQNRVSILEALNDWGRLLRMRGRPKIVLARTYEEAWRYYSTYKRNVLGVITDVTYKAEDGDEEAGLRLAEEILKDNEEIPILVQSTDIKHKEKADALGVDFLWKLSDSLLDDLGKYFLSRYNFGPFIFLNPDTGEEIKRAVTMKEVQETLKTLPIPSFRYHSKRNDFSRWLRAQSLYTLATRIKNINVDQGMEDSEVRSLLYNIIKDYRTKRARGVIATFDSSSYDETLLFSRIGNGSLGGKGRGLAFLAMEMEAYEIREKYKDVYLSIPRTIVITTEEFDNFMEINNFTVSSFSKLSDSQILEKCLSGKISSSLEHNLKAITHLLANPLSVRSSSLLEDSHDQPFAGVYSTCMIKNRGKSKERLHELEMAVKTVWASTYFSAAREYLKRTSHRPEEEKMSVLIQEIAGSDHEGFWYPEICAVARSLNYYPLPDQKSEDGIGLLSFGFGKIIVDDGTSFRFTPPYPKSSLVTSSPQENFYALDLSLSFDPEKNPDNLVIRSIGEEAERCPSALRGICSTISEKTFTLSDSVMEKGEKIVTFNGILKYDMIPFAPIVDDLLKMGREAMGEQVEIELAVNMKAEVPEIFVLQIRPITKMSATANSITEKDKEESLLLSTSVMGNGTYDNIKDIIAIKKETFRNEDMLSMAGELESLNSSLDREYVLIAPGRLGSSDRWLGIPCSWSQISKARVIVETGMKGLYAEPSQGTHFFQNITSLGCIYLTVNPDKGEGIVNYDKIYSLETVNESEHFAHLRSCVPFVIKVDALNSLGVVLLQEGKI